MKFNNISIIPIVALVMLFVYYFTSITNYFNFSLDWEANMSAKSLIIVGLEVFLLLTIFPKGRVINDKFMKSWQVLLIGMLLDIYLLSLVDRLPSVTYYLIMAMPLMVFMYMNRIVFLFDDKFILMVFVIMAIALGLHYGSQYAQALRYLNLEVMITNASYIVLLFLPLVLCLEKKILRYVLLLFIAIVVISSNKRGGIVAFALSVAVYLFINNRVNGEKRFRKVTFFLTLVMVVGSFYFLLSYTAESTDNYLYSRFENTQDDAGSGRVGVALYSMGMFANSDFGSKLIGHGWNGVLRDSKYKVSAHNDFIEVLYDYGIIVFVLYVSMIVRMFSKMSNMIKRRSKYSGQFACALILFLVLSTVSHVIIYEEILSIMLIDFVCLIHFDKIDENENRNFGISISH